MATVKTIKIEESVFADNDTAAESIRRKLTEKKTTMINVMSSPGSGKTTLLTQIVKRLGSEMRIRVMDVDIESTLDAQRVADATGVEALQIHNGGLCHIDADMVTRALEQFAPEDSGVLEQTDLLILENIGNLVCPAEFDTGAHRNMMILSVPEGDDKPLKYPLMFSVSDLVVIGKIDTLDYFDFDLEAAKERILRLNPKAVILPASARTGEGVDAICDWIRGIVKVNGQR
ncbi:MAG: hydrogenase nickel incorporation protein HypB [Lachnospiraceae bacterium]|nr:hydrogenase nickel incorporation protein HypB [Lachnospiraceae bacterium]